MLDKSDRVLRLPQVMEMTGLRRSSIYDAMKRGSFPPPLAIGARARGWLLSQVQDWVRQRVEQARKGVA